MKVNMTEAAWVALVARRINEQLDVPLMGEDREQELLEWCVGLIAPRIAPVYREIIADASDGISDAEIERWKGQLLHWLHNHVDIPGLPKFIEQRIMEPAVELLADYLKRGVSILGA